jgi:hypothetical protein
MTGEITTSVHPRFGCHLCKADLVILYCETQTQVETTHDRECVANDDRKALARAAFLQSVMVKAILGRDAPVVRVKKIKDSGP